MCRPGYVEEDLQLNCREMMDDQEVSARQKTTFQSDVMTLTGNPEADKIC